VGLGFAAHLSRGHYARDFDLENGTINGGSSVFGTKWTDISIVGWAMTREVLRVVEPDYPNWAKEREVEGAVEVMCVVLPSGEVATTVTRLISGWSELEQSVRQAVGEWRFEPIPGEEVQAGIVRVAFDFLEE